MKKSMVAMAVIAVLGIGVFAFSGSNSESNNNQAVLAEETSEVNEYETIKQEIEAGQAVMLDVRTAAEFASGHVAEADNLDVQAIQAGVLPDVEPAQKLYVYCRSGNRSAQAAALLKNAGFENIVDLGGLQVVEALGAEFVR